MIVVVADDLSGATELASAAAESGFTAEVQIDQFDSTSEADVVAISTESRHKTARLEQVQRIASQIAKARPTWIYKKTDSVLRGHVAAEITTLLQCLGLTNSLLIPANPKKARTISDGAYFVDGTPLHLTPFADDPDFPRESCDVVELARGGGRDDAAEFPVFWIGGSPLPDAKGIFIPEMESMDSMAKRPQQVDCSKTLPAGGVEFFEAILGQSARRKRPNPTSFSSATLFVCGSATAWKLGRANDFESNGIPVAKLPSDYFDNSEDRFESWLQKTRNLLKESQTVAIAIGDFASDIEPTLLLEPLSQLAQAIVREGNVERVFAEGGATAGEIIKALNWSKFRVNTPISPGIAELIPSEAPTCSIAIKPGSYPWDFTKIIQDA